jgi:hypothetical protein
LSIRKTALVFFGQKQSNYGGFIVMTRRYFWTVPEFVKFRLVFEDAETVVGAADENQYRLFRKDTGRICFDEREALRLCIVSLVESESEDFLIKKAGVIAV